MALSIPRWLGGGRIRPRDPFTRPISGDLDILKTPQYELPSALREELRAEVRAEVTRLLPNAVDAHSGEVLAPWFEARARQIVAQLGIEREERQAVGESLIGLARQEVARRRPRYEADLARLHHAREALDTTFAALTGKDRLGPFAEQPSGPDPDGVRSTLGTVDVQPDWRADPVGTDAHLDLARLQSPLDLRAVKQANGHDVRVAVIPLESRDESGRPT